MIFGKIGAIALSLGAVFWSLDKTANGKLNVNLKKIQTEFTKLSGSLTVSNQTFSQLLTRASAEIMKLLNRYPRVKSLLGSVASSVSALGQKFSFLKPHVERASSVLKTTLIPNLKNIGVTAVAAGTETQTSVRTLGTLGIVGYFAGKALKKGLAVAFTLLSWSCLGALKAIGFIGIGAIIAGIYLVIKHWDKRSKNTLLHSGIILCRCGIDLPVKCTQPRAFLKPLF